MKSPSRRSFLGVALGAGPLLAAPVSAPAAEPAAGWPAALADLPERVFVDLDGRELREAERQGARFTLGPAAVTLAPGAASTSVRVSCPSGPLCRVVLRWPAVFPEESLFLGDHWERGYGDLQWRHLQPERVMPWYFAAHHERSGRTFLAGVKTQPAALCFWTVDARGVALWLDFRNGGSPSFPGDREIAAAEVVARATADVRPFAALQAFCRALCPSPRLAPQPICGNNNWYYSYGRGFDAAAIVRDATFLAEIADGHPNRPYCVIDAGWTPGSVCPGGPWKAGDPQRFPDMPGLAAGVKRLGVRPGIWMRPTALTTVDDKRRLRTGPARDPEKPLDLTLEENLALVREDVARVFSWGYELVKHDFSTYDVFARWGFDMGAEMTDACWHFADRSPTNAEIVLRLYRTLREAAGDKVLLGCNTIGHLGAGLFEIQRTGDDTSGRVWERTRRMGVNTVAFRLPQHGAFFASDPDCAAHTAQTPWALDRRFLDLVARSGTALFVSADPRTTTAGEKAAFRDAMHRALSGGEKGGAEPLDWLHSTAPRRWRLGREETTYDWEEPFGALPARV